MIYIIISNYNTGEVLIHSITEDIANKIEDFDDYVTKELHCNLDETNYMITSILNIRII